MTTIAALRDADPHAWHRAAAGWAALADELDQTHTGLTTGLSELAASWVSGLGAQPARSRVMDHVAALRDAGPRLRRVAAVLVDHAYALAALRALAQRELPVEEQQALLARAAQLDERTSAALQALQPAGGADLLGPGRVAAWWRSLAPQERERLIRDQPQTIGWLDGVPAADRDRANRTVLATQIDQLAVVEERLTRLLVASRIGPSILLPSPLLLELALAQVRSHRAGLEAVRSALSRYPDALLLGVDSSFDGRAVVALGDPDHARHTAVFVPGINTELDDTAGYLARVSRLGRAADALTPVPGDVSAIYWLGYDPPETLGALSYGPSTAGAAQLVPFVDGLRAAHDPSPSHVTLLGHSYGSTVVAEAALRGAVPADDLVAVGSPGMHTDHAVALGLDPRHVWGGVAAGDLVGGPLGELDFVHGEEPTDPSFGANQFVVDTRGHTDYWRPGSASLRNQAAIIAGRYDLVGLVHGGPPPRFAAAADSQAAPSDGG